MDFQFNQRFGFQNKERIMKRFLILAAVTGGLTFAGLASTANADHWGGGHRGGGYGCGHSGYGRGYGGGYGRGYGYGGWGRTHGYYGNGYRPYAVPGVFIGSPGIGVGFGSGYGYPAPYSGSGYGYPSCY